MYLTIATCILSRYDASHRTAALSMSGNELVRRVGEIDASIQVCLIGIFLPLINAVLLLVLRRVGRIRAVPQFDDGAKGWRDNDVVIRQESSWRDLDAPNGEVR